MSVHLMFAAAVLFSGGGLEAVVVLTLAATGG